jgi:hypothetical protein
MRLSVLFRQVSIYAELRTAHFRNRGRVAKTLSFLLAAFPAAAPPFEAQKTRSQADMQSTRVFSVRLHSASSAARFIPTTRDHWGR